jgi:outer membrane protein
VRVLGGVAGHGMSLLLAVLLAAAPAQAQDSPPSRVLTLEAAIKTALAVNPNLAQGRSVVEQGQAAVARERSAYWPTIEAQASYDRVRRGFVGGVSGRALVNLYSQYTAGVRGQQIIYDFGRTSNRVAAARGQLEADRFGLAATQGDVVLNVKVAYFQVIEAKKLLEVAEVSITRLQQHLQQAEGMYEVGLRPKIDVTRARVDLASGIADRVRQAGALQVAKATLLNAIGVVQPLDYEVEDMPAEAGAPETLEPLVAEALERRPEVKQLQATTKGLEANVSAAWADYLPDLTGTGTYNYAGTMFPLPNNWDIGAALSVPIFNGFLTRAQVAGARATLRQAQAALEGQRLSVRLEVERAYFDVRTALEQLEAQRVAVRNAQENLDLAQARYREGLGSAVEYTDAQVALTSAQANEVQALYNVQIARATLERAVAGPTMLAAPSGGA